MSDGLTHSVPCMAWFCDPLLFVQKLDWATIEMNCSRGAASIGQSELPRSHSPPTRTGKAEEAVFFASAPHPRRLRDRQGSPDEQPETYSMVRPTNLNIAPPMSDHARDSFEATPSESPGLKCVGKIIPQGEAWFGQPSVRP